MGLWRKISVNPWFVVLLLVYIFVGQGLRMALAFLW